MKKYMRKNCPKLYKYLLKIKQDYQYMRYKRMDERDYPKELSKLYEKIYNKDLNLENPLKYSEKMQWVKLYDSSSIKTQLTDKFLVREWVKNKIGMQYLIPLLGVWDEFDQIEFDKLPNRFVLKANHGAGWNIVVKDKLKLDLNEAKEKFNLWMKKNKAFYSFEMHYKDIVPKIVAEQYIENEGEELQDYKFLCFDGVAKYCWIDVGRYGDHRRNVYDMDWKLQEWQQHMYLNTDYPIQKPENFEKMVELANKLSTGFSHVRVDLYNVQNSIYFGEMTFTNSSGFEKIHPEKFDRMLGDMWDLHKNKSL